MNDMPRRLNPPAHLIPAEPLDAPEPPPRYRPRQSGPFGVLDIGTTKIVCLIARVESDLSLRILGTGHTRARGVSSGGIVGVDDAERSIRAAVGQAELEAGISLHRVTVNLSCGQPRSQLFNIQYDIGGRAVTEADVRKLLIEARNRAGIGAEGRSIVHALPMDFEADDAQGAADPRGLHCASLAGRVHVIDAATTSLRNLDSCLARCNLDIAELVSAPMAASLPSLISDDRDLGATVLDMGGGTTGMAVYGGGHLQHVSQISLGGQHVTNDLASVLSTPVNEAERLKTLYGAAAVSPDDERQMIAVRPVGEDDHAIATVPRTMIINIIKPRIEETFEHVKARLEEHGLARLAGHRVILTGGASQLPGLPDLAQRVLGRQVRLGRLERPRGLPDSAHGPAFATALGLLAWSAGAHRPPYELDPEDERSGSWLGRIVNFLRDRV